MGLLRDDFNNITPKFKSGSPNITKWLDDATTIIERHDAAFTKLKAAGFDPAKTSIDQLAAMLQTLRSGAA